MINCRSNETSEAALVFLPLTCQSINHIFRPCAGAETCHAAMQPERGNISVWAPSWKSSAHLVMKKHSQVSILPVQRLKISNRIKRKSVGYLLFTIGCSGSHYRWDEMRASVEWERVPSPSHQLSPQSVNDFVLLWDVIGCPGNPSACVEGKNRFSEAIPPSHNMLWTYRPPKAPSSIQPSFAPWCPGLCLHQVQSSWGNTALNMSELGPEGHKQGHKKA